MRYLHLGAACTAVASFLSFAANAAPTGVPAGSDNAVVPQAVAGADYSYTSLNQGLGNANIYGGELGGIVPFSNQFSGQVAGGYHRIDSHGSGANDWNIAGTLSWDAQAGRVGVNVGYTSASVVGASAHVTNYGVYGEYYADQYTLGVRGGGATISANAFGFGTGDQTGGYVGGEAVGYLMPDFAARATVGYVGINRGHQWTAGVRGEYLFSETTPISAWLGYDYASIGASGFGSVNGNTFSVGLKYYLGGSGSLEHHQRTGEDDWGPAALDLTH